MLFRRCPFDEPGVVTTGGQGATLSPRHHVGGERGF
jgi:hypothetical protein